MVALFWALLDPVLDDFIVGDSDDGSHLLCINAKAIRCRVSQEVLKLGETLTNDTSHQEPPLENTMIFAGSYKTKRASNRCVLGPIELGWCSRGSGLAPCSSRAIANHRKIIGKSIGQKTK